MTVKALKLLIKDLDDETPILTSSSDHSYRLASLSVGTALKEHATYSEDFGEKLTPEKEYGKRIEAVIIE